MLPGSKKVDSTKSDAGTQHDDKQVCHHSNLSHSKLTKLRELETEAKLVQTWCFRQFELLILIL